MRFLAVIFLFVSPCFGQLPDAPQPNIPAPPVYHFEFSQRTHPAYPGFDFNRFADHWMTRIEKHAPTETAIARRLVKSKIPTVRVIGKGIKVQKDHVPVQPRPF